MGDGEIIESDIAVVVADRNAQDFKIIRFKAIAFAVAPLNRNDWLDFGECRGNAFTVITAVILGIAVRAIAIRPWQVIVLLLAMLIQVIVLVLQ